MKGLILAAGRGTRIRSVHRDHPKCLIQFNGSKWTILDHQVESLFAAGVENIGIVVGYAKDQIIQHIVKRYGNLRKYFHFIENPAFMVTNNIYSFWLAQNWLNGEPFICLNADVVFEPRILVPAIESSAPISMIVDPKWRDETMKVIISENRVIRMSKKIEHSQFSGTYIGITSFGAEVQERLFARVNMLVGTGYVNEFFNVAVQHLADEGVRVGFTSTDEMPWAEIDDPEDLAFARLYIFPKLTSRSLAA
jgi:choline kinase